MKIGIFGGTFNPIHCAHLSLADEVRRELNLDRVLFIPTGDPPHKKNHAIIPAGHRLTMVQMAVRGNPHFEALDLEVKRRGKSYTIDTLLALGEIYPDDTQWYLILGLDAFLEFNTWRQAKRLLRLCHFVVVSRPGFRFRDLEKFSFLKGHDPGRLTRLDKGLGKKYEIRSKILPHLILLRVKPREVSATAIRNYFGGKKEKKNILPEMVESYIMTHDLLKIKDPK